MEVVLKLDSLIDCIIIERLSRFTVKVLVNGVEEVVYLGNTGRLRGYIARGRKGFCTSSKRGKYRYKLVGVEDKGFAALVDTKLHEKSFEILLSRSSIPWLKRCRIVKRNVLVFDNIIDYLIQCNGSEVFVEVKSAVMDLDNGFAAYPDAPTERGRKQLEALTKVVESSGKGRAVVIFIAGIPMAKGFKLFCEVDKAICNAVKKALDVGVMFKALNLFLDPKSLSVVVGDLDLPVDLSCCTY